MRSCTAVLASAVLLAGVAAPVRAAEPAEAAAADTGPAPAAPKPGPARKNAAIVLHEGIPRVAFLGQPLAEFIASFPSAASTPFAGQTDVVRLQVPGEGLSALAMGVTPATMTIESIGFNFAGEYEGVKETTRRTAEGIGAGSTVNDLLGTYGRQAETAPEGRRSVLAPQAAAPDRNAPVRYLYRSVDATIATYFVVEGSLIRRMAMSRPASVERWLLKRSDQAPGAPAAPGSPPATNDRP